MGCAVEVRGGDYPVRELALVLRSMQVLNMTNFDTEWWAKAAAFRVLSSVLAARLPEKLQTPGPPPQRTGGEVRMQAGADDNSAWKSSPSGPRLE